jgi:hypothetical protein
LIEDAGDFDLNSGILATMHDARLEKVWFVANREVEEDDIACVRFKAFRGQD